MLSIALIVTNRYLQSNQTKVLSKLPFLNEGIIRFEKAQLDIWEHFPSVAIQLEEVVLEDSLSKETFLSIKKVTADASLAELLNQKIDLKAIHLEDGSLFLHTDSSGNSNIKRIFQQKSNDLKPKKENNFKVNLDGLQVQLSNFSVHITDVLKDQNIQGRVERLVTELEIGENKSIRATIDLKVAVQELALKKRNGSFVENSQLQGKLVVNVTDSLVQIPPFDLHINEELFVFNGDIYTKGNQVSQLNFENKNTHLESIKLLLPQNIRKSLKAYHIAHPFYSKTSIQSDFKPGSNPVITVDFDLQENDLDLFNIALNQSNLKGRFINRLYDDERQTAEEKGNVRVIIDELSGTHGQFLLESESVLIHATKATGASIQSAVQINGQANGMSEWLNNDQFFFEKGDFQLTAHVNGSLKDINDIIIESDAQLSLKDFSVFYEPSQTTFPFTELSLDKKVGDAYFTITNNTFVEGHHISVDGGLKNLPALLLELSGQQPNSEVNIVSKKLSWQDFLDLFGENGYLKNKQPKTESEKKKSMKATISGIENSFQPRITFKIDTLEYSENLQLLNFETGVHFEDAHTLVLENTHFELDESIFDFNARVDISDPNHTPFEFNLKGKRVNLQNILPKFNYFNVKLLEDIGEHPEDVTINVQHKAVIDDQKGLVPNTGEGKITLVSNKNKTGKIEVEYTTNYQAGMPLAAIKSHTNVYMEGDPIGFNDFFKTETFFFSKGQFQVHFDYEGDFYSVKDLLEASKTTFTLTDSEVYYKPSNVVFPLTKIELTAHDNHADFNFLLHHDSLNRELVFTGKLENITELVLGNTGKQVHTKMDITSPKMLSNELMKIFKTEQATPKQEFAVLKKTLINILNKFDPDIHLKIDTFQYADLVTVENLITGIHIQDSTTIVLENTGFDFHKGNLNFNGQITLHEDNPMPFELELHTRNFDLGGLLEELDYLEVPVLKDMEALNGRLTMDLNLRGAFTPDGKELIETANEGVLFFNLEDLEIKGLLPLDSIAAKLQMRKRFEDVRFAPIIDTIFFKQTNIEIPLMEIQSTALHLFVEGNFGKGDDTNLWLSIPLDNLKITDRSVIPEKLGYAAANHKVYLEAISTKEGKIHLKFHPTKKKYYLERGIPEQYKADKKRDRAIHKAMKRGF